jgi:chromate transporter
MPIVSPPTPDDAPPAADRTEPRGAAEPRASALGVFVVFLRLGLTSFGGPVAHLGYFRAEFVGRLRWLGDRDYTDLVALCQFLPGPASSQVGMALGMRRAGLRGAFAAWAGFTLPSALGLMLLAYGMARHHAFASSGAIHGLEIAAVAVVAQAVWAMARTLCPDRPRAALAIVAALITLALPSATGQVGAIVLCALVGWRTLSLPHAPATVHATYGVSKNAAVAALVLFVALLVGLPAWAAVSGSQVVGLIDGFYRAGALVFGGGHVVLPLLQAVVVPSGAVSNEAFLAGYGAAQAVPGPLFSFAAYLGALVNGPLSGWVGGLFFLVVIYVPAFLVLIAALPFWESLRRRDAMQSALAGVNAAVVGILLSALYDPLWTSAILSRADFALLVAVFGLLQFARIAPAIVVVLAAIGGLLQQDLARIFG